MMRVEMIKHNKSLSKRRADAPHVNVAVDMHALTGAVGWETMGARV